MQEILELIQARESVRGPFDPGRPVSRPDLERILEAGRWAPTAHNMQNFETIVVDDPELLAAMGRLRSPVSPDFIRENYRQLSFSEAELRRKKVGILADRFPPAWVNPEASPAELAATERPLPTSPTMLVMTYDPGRRAPASEGDFLGVISLGCATENMWLMAAALGIGFHIVSSFGEEPLATALKELLQIPAALKVVYAIQLGYPPDGAAAGAYLRVRRDLPDFTHHNRFGNQGLG